MSSVNEPFTIHPKTSLAHLELQVNDLANMVAFYGDLMGFQLIEKQGGQARLSSTGQPPTLLTLTERKDAKRQASHSVGLYHTAFRFIGRKALATTLLRIVASRWPLQGASDHRVSEAIYLADPEGNGIEIYRDRPRDQWPRLQETIQMGNLPLDLPKLLEEADQGAAQAGAIDQSTDLGHMHLQVSDLASADAFYHHLLGLDVIMSMPTALFMSAGGYHHHLGVNTWHSLHASRRNKDALGLKSYAILIPDEDNWLNLFQRIQSDGRKLQAFDRDSQLGVVLEDEDGIGVEVLTLVTEKVSNAISGVPTASLASSK